MLKTARGWHQLETTTMAWSVWLAIAVVHLLLICVHADSSSKPVTTVLYASWPETSLLLEASEFMSDYEENVFWQFVNKVNILNATTDKDVYTTVTDIARELVPLSVYQLLVLSLSLRTYSPTLEMYRQVAEEELRTADSEIECLAFVAVNGRLHCSIEILEESVQPESETLVYDFDHKYHGYHSNGSTNTPLVILYAELGSVEFVVLHEQLSTLAQERRIQYVFRHYVKIAVDSKQPILSGYGVQLSVKSTEYKAMDDSEVKGDSSRVAGQNDGDDEVEGFLFNTLKSRFPSLEDKLKDYRSHLVHGSREMPELRPWQIQDLGFQAAQRISTVHPDHALKALTDLAQNLPMQAKSLSKVLVNKKLRQEIQSNQKVMATVGIEPGDNVLLLNNMVIQTDHMDVFQLLSILMSEVHLVEGLHSLSIHPDHYLTLLSLAVHNEAKKFALDVRNESVVFINDLEKDKLYSSWPSSLRQFLQPTYPGMLRQIARNVFNIVFMFDPMTSEGAELVEYIKLFLDHMVPARLGVLIVPQTMSEGGVAICRGFHYLVQHKSPREALRWLHKLYNLKSSPTELNEDDIIENFKNKFTTYLSNEVFSEDHDTLCKKSAEFFEDKGLDLLPQVLVNGVQLDMEEDLESSVVMAMQRQTFEVQQSLFMKRLKDKDDVYNYFMNKSNVLSRVNKYVVANSDVYDLSSPVPAKNIEMDSLSSKQLSSAVANNLNYFMSKQGEFTTKELSLWVIADFSSDNGRQTAQSVLKYVLTTDLVRAAFVHTEHTFVAMVIEAVFVSQSHERAWQFITAILHRPHPPSQFDEILDLVQQLHLNMDSLVEALNSSSLEWTISAHIKFTRLVLGLTSGHTALLSNGRVIGPFDTLQSADIAMLHHFESATHSAVVLEGVGGVKVDGISPDEDTSEFRSDLVMKLSSLLRSQPRRRRLAELSEMLAEYSGIHLSSEEPALQLVAFIDPLSPSTQKIAPLLEILHTAVTSDLSIHFNPVSKLSQMPIKSFYRYVLQPTLKFDETGGIEITRAVFSDLPHSPLLTMHLDTPHSWLVEAVWSPHDLDNIYLADITQAGVHADFELKHILVEGQCFDATTDSPTPGLQYVLGSSTQPDLFDTVVMANLGYFQLKASPGAWTLKLREGRSSTVYYIQSHMGGDQVVKRNEGKVPINVNSFKGAGVVVRVAKLPGMESFNLLVDESQEQDSSSVKEPKPTGNIWSTISNLIHGEGDDKEEIEGTKLQVAENETINIFSLASGHLYERFLRIMMLSVIKHTHNPVKFWFLKNFLSPTFKSFISVMASKYGFDYELVEYQWPRWLHAQTEKQRIIWGYKILFLDVLFPLNVKKIIFVDADQIVRANLKELLEIPLNGAPYAYTPFCDSRPEMAGFRFWESGYWKNHLGNRRYHISALYVVDLQRFRLIGAGDRLRGQYQALSQDPNSLANLDQDLPNNMIHAVPIKSLPQEWLWCETWCSLESKSTAKTIDLCNNPMTKEPKLKSAVRIVPEWTDYDNEIKELWNEYKSSSDDNSERKHIHTEL